MSFHSFIFLSSCFVISLFLCLMLGGAGPINNGADVWANVGHFPSSQSICKKDVDLDQKHIYVFIEEHCEILNTDCVEF